VSRRFDKSCFESVESLSKCLQRYVEAGDWDQADALLREARRRDLFLPYLDWLQAFALSERGLQQEDVTGQVECYRQAWKFMEQAAEQDADLVLDCGTHAPWAIPGCLSLLKSAMAQAPPAGEQIRDTLKATIHCGRLEEHQRQEIIEICQELLDVIDHWPAEQSSVVFTLQRQVERTLRVFTERAPMLPSEIRLIECVRQQLRRFHFKGAKNEYVEEAPGSGEDPLLAEIRLSAAELIDRLHHEEKGVRARAAAILGKRKAAGALDALWSVKRSDGDRAVRSMAVVAISETLHPHSNDGCKLDDTAGEILKMLANDRSQDGRMHAARAIGLLGYDSPEVRRGLLDTLFSENPKMKGAREGVIEAVGRLGYDDADVRKRLYDCYNEDKWLNVKRAVINALGRFGKRCNQQNDAKEIVAVLSQILVNTDRKSEVFSDALCALKRWGRRAESVLEILETLALPAQDLITQCLEGRLPTNEVEVLETILHVSEPGSGSYEDCLTSLLCCARIGDWPVLGRTINADAIVDHGHFDSMVMLKDRLSTSFASERQKEVRFAAMRTICKGPVDRKLKTNMLVGRMWMDWAPEVRLFAAEELIQLDEDAANLADAWSFTETCVLVDPHAMWDRIWNWGQD